MKMRIIIINNETDWSTADIRRIFIATIKAEGMERKHWRLDVKYSRQGMWKSEDGTISARRIGGVMGYGYYNRAHIILSLPNTMGDAHPWDKPTKRIRVEKIDPCRVADLFVHEFAHNRGLKHGEMIKGGGHHTSCEYVADFPLRRKTLPKKKTAEDREAKALAEVERIEARLADLEKSHKSMMTRWRKKLTKAKMSMHYYQRKKAAMPKTDLLKIPPQKADKRI